MDNGEGRSCLGRLSGYAGTALLLLVCLVVAVGRARAEGINLSWDDCGLSGSEVKIAPGTCNYGWWSLYASFKPPTGITSFTGFEATVYFFSASPWLPKWWEIGAGYCRSPNVLVSDVAPFPVESCGDPFFPVGGGIQHAYTIHACDTPSAAKLSLFASAVPFSRSLDPGQEYYAFRLRIYGSCAQCDGARCASCPGDDVPVTAFLSEIVLIQTGGVRHVIRNPLNRAAALWQTSSPFPIPPQNDADGDGFWAGCGDCNDSNPNIYPGAPELCNGVDDDCDGQIDEGLPATTFYRDADGDGYGNPASTLPACAVPVGYSANGLDCDDADAAIYPGAPDTTCNGIDENCNGQIDDGFPGGCQCTSPAPGLVGWWPGEGNANDARGANHGVLQNGATAAGAGRVGQAFSLDGTDDHVRVAHHPLLDPGSGSFTVAAWIRTSVTGPAQVVLSKYECGGFCPAQANPLYGVDITGGGIARLQIRDLDSGAVQTLSGGGSLSDGAWHHVAAGRDMATSRMFLYVDGALVASSPLSSFADGVIADSDGEPDPLVIGAQFTAGSTTLNSFFAGQIDEVAYYNRALRAREVRAIYDTGSAAMCRCIDADGDGYGRGGGLSCPAGTLPDCDDTDAQARPGAAGCAGCPPAGTACNDGNGCTAGDACAAGRCLPGARLVQAAGSPIAGIVSAYSIATGDWDRDGDIDLAVASATLTGRVAILLGNGAGGFTQAAGSPVTVGSYPVSLAAGDFNRDGRSDLVVANNGSNTVTLLLGNGAGGFTPAGAIPVGTLPNALAVADLDRNGTLDVVVANGGSNVTVLLGNGGGGFTQPAGSPFPAGGWAQSVAIAHLDGDSHLDLAVANPQAGTVSILLGNGSGAFAPGSTHLAAGPESVAVGDLNGDGRADLVLANSAAGKLAILLGNGSGGFAETASSPIPVGADAQAVAIEDFNGDGFADLAVAGATSNRVTVLLGDGSGVFGDAAGSPIALTNGPVALAVAAIDADGRPDIAAAGFYGGSVSILLSQPTPLPGPCSCPRPSGLVGWWRGDGSAADSRGTNHGVLQSDAYYAPGKTDRAFRLDGIDDSVDGIGALSSFAFVQNTGVFTIDAWIRLDDINGLTQQAITANTATTAEKGHYFTWRNLDGQRRLHVALVKGVANDFVVSSFSPPNVITTPGWHHVAVVGNGTTVTFYVDGVAHAGSGAFGAPSTGDSSRTLSIGRCPWTSPLCQFQGRIDEVHVFNRALSAAEIQAIYAADAIGVCRCIDADGDGYGAQAGVPCVNGMLQDCNEANPGLWRPPVEATNLRLAGKTLTTLTWADQSAAVGPSGLAYDVFRGSLASWPVGSGTETCLAPAVSSPTATDASIPSTGSGFRYLVRGRNPCGIGTYGTRSNGAPRVSTACP